MKNGTARVVRGALVACVAIIIGAGFATSVAQSDESASTPPRPPWVNEDGTVNTERVPTRAPVLGPDGKPVVDDNGREVMVDLGPLVPPGDAGGSGQPWGPGEPNSGGGVLREEVKPKQYGR